MLADASNLSGTLLVVDGQRKGSRAGVFYQPASRVVQRSFSETGRNRAHFAVASAFWRPINYERTAVLGRSSGHMEDAMSMRHREEGVSEAWLRMRTAARTRTGSVFRCACRGRLLCVRWPGGIIEVPDGRREHHKIDVGSIY